MATIKIYDGKAYTNIEVTDEFAAAYSEIERAERLKERKETRRHQSYNLLHDNGFEFADESADVWALVVHNYDKARLSSAISKLTERQRAVFLYYVLGELTYREIGELLGLGTYTVRDYYYNAIKKLQKILS